MSRPRPLADAVRKVGSISCCVVLLSDKEITVSGSRVQLLMQLKQYCSTLYVAYLKTLSQLHTSVMRNRCAAEAI
jgi:hypothetical protein